MYCNAKVSVANSRAPNKLSHNIGCKIVYTDQGNYQPFLKKDNLLWVTNVGHGLVIFVAVKI